MYAFAKRWRSCGGASSGTESGISQNCLSEGRSQTVASSRRRSRSNFADIMTTCFRRTLFFPFPRTRSGCCVLAVSRAWHGQHPQATIARALRWRLCRLSELAACHILHCNVMLIECGAVCGLASMPWGRCFAVATAAKMLSPLHQKCNSSDNRVNGLMLQLW